MIIGGIAMLYLIGLGLNDENDLSLKAINAMKKCSSVYCEMYTGKWYGDLKKLEAMTGKPIQILRLFLRKKSS